jgi:hypothetical protein
LLDDSPSSCPERGGVGGKTTGHESENPRKTHADATTIRVPESRDTNGTRTDTNQKTAVSGHESAVKAWEIEL